MDESPGDSEHVRAPLLAEPGSACFGPGGMASATSYRRDRALSGVWPRTGSLVTHSRLDAKRSSSPDTNRDAGHERQPQLRGRPPICLRHRLVDVERRLLWWRRETALDSLLHARHQDVVAEAVPTVLRLVDGHDRPSVGRRTGGMEDLPVWQRVRRWVDGRDRCLVLLLGSTRKVMDNSMGHVGPLSIRVPRQRSVVEGGRCRA